MKTESKVYLGVLAAEALVLAGGAVAAGIKSILSRISRLENKMDLLKGHIHEAEVAEDRKRQVEEARRLLNSIEAAKETIARAEKEEKRARMREQVIEELVDERMRKWEGKGGKVDA